MIGFTSRILRGYGLGRAEDSAAETKGLDSAEHEQKRYRHIAYTFSVFTIRV